MIADLKSHELYQEYGGWFVSFEFVSDKLLNPICIVLPPKMHQPQLDPYRNIGDFNSRRSTVYSTHGIVASSQPLASQIGIDILKQGGNAADAAVAVAAALNVTEPGCTGIGGDLFTLFFDAKSGVVKGLNGSGRAPESLTLARCRELGIDGESIPTRNINAVTVPGAAAGWVDTVETFGSGKLTLGQILEPAIRLAEEGFPVAPISAWMWERSEKLLQTASPNGGEMLRNGKAPKTGEIMKMPFLAKTFRTLATQGKKGFYTGRIAEEIVKVIRDLGGELSLKDLEAHTSTFPEPISITYKDDITIYECAPNGQGITALMALGILEELQANGKSKELEGLEHNSVEYLHAVIEALRIAFADTRYYVTDPDVVNVPVKEMLSKEYLKKRAELFDPSRAAVDVQHGSPANSSDTVYFSVVDNDGNACSFIISNYEGFGTGVIPHGCGFTLQNRGSNFTLIEGHPNCIAPRKRPYHTIIPAIATKEGKLWLCYGVMGGFMQPQGHVQVLLNLLHPRSKNDAQTSLDLPRICISPEKDGTIFIEEGISDDVVKKLEAMGHKVRVLRGEQRAMFGRGQVIMVREDAGSVSGRVLGAGSDPRADGCAIGY
ncbi:hypothetical protein HDV05_004199 [Chytridiales sp. JEL 0842]|nr:hypothetical protein HDV05_004199 [Chytridiales sp. JEL 0842]